MKYKDSTSRWFLLMFVLVVYAAMDMPEVAATPQTPSAISAEPNADGSVQLTWNGVSDATGYWVCASLPYSQQCAGGSSTTNGKYKASTGTGQKNTRLSLSEGHYIWKVRACDSNNYCSAWSAYGVFDMPSRGPRFSQTLASTYRSPRCVNCHHFLNSAGRSSELKYQSSLKLKGPMQRAAPPNASMFKAKPGTKQMHIAAGRGANCTSCHMSDWIPAPRNQDFKGRSSSQLCRMTKRHLNNDPVRVKQHLKEDPRIIWAIRDATGNIAPPSGRATPGNISTWNGNVDMWVDGGMNCQ